MNTGTPQKQWLVLGIGNLLMGDEGVGVHVIRHLQRHFHLPQAELVDGGTGGFHLLDLLSSYKNVLLIDATLDGKPPGTLSILRPKFSSDYPPTLTAHDIGLKDLLDSLYLSGARPDITLFAISIAACNQLSLELSPEIQAAVPEIAEAVVRHIQSHAPA